MKLTVLVDNNTFIDRYYYGEPAVSFHIEDGNTRLLFDLGYSGLFMENAAAMGISLSGVTEIVISHGHNDHTGGFDALISSGPGRYNVIAHPHAFNEKELDGVKICSPLRAGEIREHFGLTLSREPLKLSENLYFLGEIPKANDFEIRKPIGRHKINGVFTEDYVTDDTALAYKGRDGLYIITGCSHSGICNIIERAKAVCGDSRVVTVFGGFHLFDITPRLKKTIEYFMENRIEEIYPCHCVSLKVKAEMSKFLNVHEVGVGMEVVWPPA